MNPDLKAPGTQPIVHAKTRTVDPKVTAHFHASATLYGLWSPERHLHFGYWRWPMDPFDRRAMLEELVHQVARPLGLRCGDRVADLGCGYGSAARLIARSYDTHVDAFTVVPEQFEEGRTAAWVDGLQDLVTMHLRDFRETALPDGSIDAVIGMESLCYGNRHGKADVLAEAARILKPGGHISLVDGFLLKKPTGLRVQMVRTVEQGWALPSFPHRAAFLREMTDAGFTDITVKDLSWRVAICALHGPPLMLWRELRRLLAGRPLPPLERAHLRSCMLGILLGTQRDLFRYLHITARRV